MVLDGLRNPGKALATSPLRRRRSYSIIQILYQPFGLLLSFLFLPRYRGFKDCILYRKNLYYLYYIELQLNFPSRRYYS